MGVTLQRLSDAALELGMPWRRAYDLMLSGCLRGERRGARWFVSRESVAAFRRELEMSTPRSGSESVVG